MHIQMEKTKTKTYILLHAQTYVYFFLYIRTDDHKLVIVFFWFNLNEQIS